jgi:hypothetical protein
VRVYRPFERGGAHQNVAVSKGAFALLFSPEKPELAVTTQAGIDFYSIK